MKNYPLHQSLKARGLNTEKLARLIGTGRAHLTDVLNNMPGHGHFTRPKLFPHLTDEEIQLLGWQGEHQRWKERIAARST